MSPPPPPKPTKFGKPEEKNWVRIIGFWCFVLFGLVAIVLLWLASPPLKNLNCGGSSYSINGWGSCTTE